MTPRRHRPAVPPWVQAGGRSEASVELGWRLETLLRATGTEDPLPEGAVTRGHRELLAYCEGLTSIVEAAAHMGQPVSTIRVLAGDLIGSGHLTVPDTPAPTGELADSGPLTEPVQDASSAPRETRRPGPSLDVLKEVLGGLRNLA